MKNLNFPGSDTINSNHFSEGVILVFDDNRTIGFLSTYGGEYFFNERSNIDYDQYDFDSLSEMLDFIKSNHPNAELKLFN